MAPDDGGFFRDERAGVGYTACIRHGRNDANGLVRAEPLAQQPSLRAGAESQQRKRQQHDALRLGMVEVFTVKSRSSRLPTVWNENIPVSPPTAVKVLAFGKFVLVKEANT